MGLIYKKLFEKSQTKATLNLFLPDGTIVWLGFLGLCFKHILTVFLPKQVLIFRPSLFVTVIASTLVAYILPSLLNLTWQRSKCWTISSHLLFLLQNVCLIKCGDRKSIMIIITLILVSSKILLHFLISRSKLSFYNFSKLQRLVIGPRFSIISREKVHEKLSFRYFSLKSDTNSARKGLRQNFQPFKIIMELESFLTARF